MDGRDKKMNDALTGRETDGDIHSRTVLAVALAPQALDLLPRHVLEPHSYIARVGYDELDSVSFAGPQAPALVLSPLLTPVFDAIDLARYLSQRGYRGRYLALVDRLPSANLIRREVEAQSPDLNFDVVVLDGSSPLHSL
jgi:CheY-like chemotaxis protein